MTTLPSATSRAAWKRYLTVGFKVAVSVGLLVYLVHRGGLAAIDRSLRDADPRWLAGGYALGQLGAALTIWQWWGVLDAIGLKRRYRRCVRLELAGDVFDAALPSSIGGDVFRAVAVTEAPAERELGVASVIIRRLCNFPGMVALMAVGTVTTALAGQGRVPWAPVLAALSCGLFLVALVVSPLAGRAAATRPLRRPMFAPAVKVLRRLDYFRLQRRDLIRASMRGCLFWCCAVASQWCYMRAVGADRVPLWYAAVVVTVTNMVTMLPIALGGYGLRETTFSALLASAGMATVAQGVAVGACLTGQTVLFGLSGIPVYLSLRKRRDGREPGRERHGAHFGRDLDLTRLGAITPSVGTPPGTAVGVPARPVPPLAVPVAQEMHW
ncbi:MAG TPA: lysylphosphatidylglycerol synthase transmembrane domain-containing protein [Acidimicrobiales bacterium]|nr:lysylphosphatidylglycerol synthase transmembrane domain-containing protein [Acidimicrobiales bacterium]